MIKNMYDSNMINELKEWVSVINKVIELDNKDLNNIIKSYADKIVIITWMWSSYFISEIWKYFLKNIAWIETINSVSADELINEFPKIDNRYSILTFSQSWNTVEVTDILEQMKEKNIETFSIYNNEDATHKDLSKYSFFQDIEKEKSPVSTKYITYSLCLIYKLSIISWFEKWAINLEDKDKLLADLFILLEDIELLFKNEEEHIKVICGIYTEWDNFLIIWDWIDWAISKEISLKIRESTWLNASYDNVWQLVHWWINSINEKTICILFSNNDDIVNRIKDRWWKVIIFWCWDNSTFKTSDINEYLNSVSKIIVWQLFVHHLACSLWIDTDKKMW